MNRSHTNANHETRNLEQPTSQLTRVQHRLARNVLSLYHCVITYVFREETWQLNAGYSSENHRKLHPAHGLNLLLLDFHLGATLLCSTLLSPRC